jgi:hypothetical protein
MKKVNTSKSYVTLILLLSFLCLMLSSCRKNKKCDLVVTVTNATTNGPVVGAKVHIYPNRTSTTNGSLKDQDQTQTTDASGVARFTFKLPAILAADVTPPTPLGPESKLVKLEEGKSVSVTIKVS